MWAIEAGRVSAGCDLEAVDTSPIELRLRNARFCRVEVEEAVKSHPHHNAPMEEANRGRGVAVGYRLVAAPRWPLAVATTWCQEPSGRGLEPTPRRRRSA